MSQAIIKITVQGGCVEVSLLPDSGHLASLPPSVQVWDYDCEGGGGNHEDAKGDPFDLAIYGERRSGWKMNKITTQDLECKPIFHDV
jgi:hypothetical protein